MTSSIFISKNFEALNIIDNEHIINIGQDHFGHQFLQIKKINLIRTFLHIFTLGYIKTNHEELGLIDLLKYILKIDNFSISKIKKIAKQEIHNIHPQNSCNRKLIERNIKIFNSKYSTDFNKPLFTIAKAKSSSPHPQISCNLPSQLKSKNPITTFQEISSNATQKNEGEAIQPNELAFYVGSQELCHPNVLYLGLGKEASQYYKGAATGPGQSSPSCTLFATQFADNILFSKNYSEDNAFDQWVEDFSKKSPLISNHQTTIINSVRSGLRVKLLAKKRIHAAKKTSYQIMLKSYLEKNVNLLRNFRQHFIKTNYYSDLMNPQIWNNLTPQEQQNFEKIKEANANLIKHNIAFVHPDELQGLGYLNRELSLEEVLQIKPLFKKPENFQQILSQIEENISYFLKNVWEEKIPGEQLQNALHQALFPALSLLSLKVLNDQIKDLICRTYVDQRFGTGDLTQPCYTEIVPKCIQDLTPPKVIKHTEAALANVINTLTRSKRCFPYAIITTPNSQTYSLIYSSKRDLTIVFDSHRSCAYLVKGSEGLFSLLKNIHTGQNLDSGKKFEDQQKPPFVNEREEPAVDPNAPDYLEQLQIMFAFGGNENEIPESIVAMCV